MTIETKTEKAINLLIKRGCNKQNARAYIEKNIECAVSFYPDASPAFIVDFCMSVN